MDSFIILVSNVEDIEIQKEIDLNKSSLFDDSDVEWMYNSKET